MSPGSAGGGPVEAAALGNALMQYQGLGVVDADVAVMRRLVAASFPTTLYEARAVNDGAWVDAEDRLLASRA